MFQQESHSFVMLGLIHFQDQWSLKYCSEFTLDFQDLSNRKNPTANIFFSSSEQDIHSSLGLYLYRFLSIFYMRPINEILKGT